MLLEVLEGAMDLGLHSMDQDRRKLTRRVGSRLRNSPQIRYQMSRRISVLGEER